jgi:hypothetical protein
MSLSKIIILLLTFASFSALANQTEINHLLEFVKSTECQYERNGDMHNGQEAFKHIKRKYKHFKDDIDTTESFIKLSATKSKMSGKKYRIHCQGQPIIYSQDWLLAELLNFRSLN